MDVNAIIEGVKQLNLIDASLYGTAFGLGVLLRLARAAWFHFGDSATGAAAIGLGVLGACLQLTMTPHPWQFIVLQSLMLGGVVALVELALRSAADSNIPILNKLPSDNAWVKKPPTSGDVEGK